MAGLDELRKHLEATGFIKRGELAGTCSQFSGRACVVLVVVERNVSQTSALQVLYLEQTSQHR